MALDCNRIQALCFDVDGTLRDTDDQYVQRLVSYLKPIRPFLPRRDLKLMARRLIMAIEDPGNLALDLADRLGIDNLTNRLLQSIERPRQRLKIESKAPTIPGVNQMLDALHPRYPMAIVSARGEGATLDFLESQHLTRYFQVIVTGQTCARTKPHPMPVLWAAAKLGVAVESCLMIGDTKVDIRSGRTAGAQTVGVLCGFGTEDELAKAGADVILKSSADLADHLGKHRSGA